MPKTKTKKIKGWALLGKRNNFIIAVSKGEFLTDNKQIYEKVVPCEIIIKCPQK